MAKKDDADVLMWQNRLAASREARDNVAREAGWDRLMEEYRLIWRVLEGKLKNRIVPINQVFSFAKTEVPSLYFRDPYISVLPRKTTAESILKAKLTEGVENFQWKTKRMKQEVKKSILRALVVESAWIKTGYAAEISVEGNAGAGKNGPRLDVNERVRDDDIFSYSLSWRDVLFSLDATDPPHDARWMAFRFIKPTEALRASSRYQTAGLEPNFSLFTRDMEPDRRKTVRAFKPGDTPMTVGWEVWDKDSGTKFSLAEGYNRFLVEPVKWPYPFSDFPVDRLLFNEDPDSPYGISSIAPWEKNLLEKMKFRAMQVNHVKRWNRMIIMRKGVLSKEEKDKYLDNLDGSVIEAKSQNLGGDFFVPQYPEFQADSYIIEDRMDRDIIGSSGQPEFRRGGTTPIKTRTLGELDLLSENTSVMLSERQDVVEDFCESIAAKHVKLMARFFDAPRVASISDLNDRDLPAALQKFFEIGNRKGRFFGNSFRFNREDLLDDVDIDIKKGSSAPLNLQNQQQILSGLISSVGQALPPPVLSAMVKEFVSSFGLKTIEKAFDDAEAEARVQRVVQQALAAERDSVRQGAVTARNLGIAAGESGLEVPEAP